MGQLSRLVHPGTHLEVQSCLNACSIFAGSNPFVSVLINTDHVGLNTVHNCDCSFIQEVAGMEQSSMSACYTERTTLSIEKVLGQSISSHSEYLEDAVFT